MGNSALEGFNLEQQYKDNGSLPFPDPHALENQFEKEVYMSINLIRTNP